MAASSITVLAGMVSTSLFVVSCLPMLVKAFRTRDLTSYSLGNLLLATVGNAGRSQSGQAGEALATCSCDRRVQG